MSAKVRVGRMRFLDRVIPEYRRQLRQELQDTPFKITEEAARVMKLLNMAENLLLQLQRRSPEYDESGNDSDKAAGDE